MFLFPGTGSVQETGAGRGRGFSVNVPLYPYTSDETYLWAFGETVPPLLRAFNPDVLVTQLGIDSHYRDPITHLALTSQGFAQVVSEFATLAPDRWLALGGGGYDLQAVARSWTMAYGILSDQSFPDAIPQIYRAEHGVESLKDPDDLPIDPKLIQDSRSFAEASVQSVHRLIFPTFGITGA